MSNNDKREKLTARQIESIKYALVENIAVDPWMLDAVCDMALEALSSATRECTDAKEKQEGCFRAVRAERLQDAREKQLLDCQDQLITRNAELGETRAAVQKVLSRRCTNPKPVGDSACECCTHHWHALHPYVVVPK